MTGIITKGEKRLVIVSGRAHPELAQDVASELGTEVLSSTAYDFANGETYVRFNESVRGCDVFVVQVINSTTNLAALTFFIPQGHVVWAWAIPLALANLCGGVVGAKLAIRGGTKFLRYGFMVLLCLTIGKFAWDLIR